jgi:hypothetical protein
MQPSLGGARAWLSGAVVLTLLLAHVGRAQEAEAPVPSATGSLAGEPPAAPSSSCPNPYR